MHETDISYDGSQLAPHWIYETFDLVGDSVVGFLGPAEVTLSHMVDREDVKRQSPIASPRMLHFIGEWFIDSLEVGILLQHLFMDQIYEGLFERGIRDLKRQGNDIWYRERKLSVSICTKSTVSVLMHSGLNVQTEGTPIPTSGLAEMGIDPRDFGREMLERFSADYARWQKARVKVSPR